MKYADLVDVDADGNGTIDPFLNGTPYTWDAYASATWTDREEPTLTGYKQWLTVIDRLQGNERDVFAATGLTSFTGAGGYASAQTGLTGPTGATGLTGSGFAATGWSYATGLISRPFRRGGGPVPQTGQTAAFPSSSVQAPAVQSQAAVSDPDDLTVSIDGKTYAARTRAGLAWKILRVAGRRLRK